MTPTKRITATGSAGRERCRLPGGAAPFRLAAAALALLAAAPALAGASPRSEARLVRCGEESCLRVTGSRQNSAQAVMVNGHVVPARGERRWQVVLPLASVRQWSALHARTIEVAVGTATGTPGDARDVDLPIGLLGGTTDLAALEISLS